MDDKTGIVIHYQDARQSDTIDKNDRSNGAQNPGSSLCQPPQHARAQTGKPGKALDSQTSGTVYYQPPMILAA